ncbi:MAG: sulfurtransferase [Spirochaetae bacterium HGW-Spirochaetae-1]|jgi:rhodanese-related sulfurtransferase|nr:MAG: sulfurtransferase [Spirochaetae bacterium HGW-Spirochaetae-1]
MDKNTDRISRFLAVMDGSFRMKPPQWVLEQSREGQSPVIVDVRDRAAFEKSRISGSINIPLKELPDLYEKLIPDRQAIIVCVCNGSVQSAYAIMFLYSRGYDEVYNLSGGMGRWQKEELPMENK